LVVLARPQVVREAGFHIADATQASDVRIVRFQIVEGQLNANRPFFGKRGKAEPNGGGVRNQAIGKFEILVAQCEFLGGIGRVGAVASLAFRRIGPRICRPFTLTSRALCQQLLGLTRRWPVVRDLRCGSGRCRPRLCFVRWQMRIR
jgi:hypothetical protein